MKKNLLCLFAVTSLLLSTSAQAEIEPKAEVTTTAPSVSESSKTILFRVNAFEMIFSGYPRLSIDVAAAPRLTIGAYGTFQTAKPFTLGVPVPEGTGAWASEAGHNVVYYLTGSRLASGYYISPQVGFVLAEGEHLGVTGGALGIKGQVSAGFIEVYRSGLMLQWGVGASYSTVPSGFNVNGMNVSLPRHLSGWGWVAYWDIGWAF